MRRIACLICGIVFVLIAISGCDECKEAFDFWAVVKTVGEHPAHHYGREDAAIEVIAPAWGDGNMSQCESLTKAEEINVDGVWISSAEYPRKHRGCDLSQDELNERFNEFRENGFEGKYPPCTCSVWLYASPDDALPNFTQGEGVNVTAYTGDWCDEGDNNWFN